MSWYDKAIDTIQPHLAMADDRRKLLMIHQARARAFATQAEYDRSLAAWQSALEAADDGSSRDLLLSQRITTIARQGKHRRAADEVAQISARDDLPAEALYHLACGMGEAIAAATVDESLETDELTLVSERYARSAIALLYRSRAKGYFNQKRSAKILEAESLARLLHRDDFKLFVDALAK